MKIKQKSLIKNKDKLKKNLNECLFCKTDSFGELVFHIEQEVGYNGCIWLYFLCVFALNWRSVFILIGFLW